MSVGSLKSFLIHVAILIACFTLCAADVSAAPEIKVATVAPAVRKLPVVEKNDIRFRRLSSEGLSQTRVGQIVQDNDGYLWFGTQNGVSRYDGYQFHVFKHTQNDPTSLSGVYIYGLFKDMAGTIWVASDQYLDAFDAQTGEFRHYSVDTDNPTVSTISQDDPDCLWLSTGKGLYRFDIKTGKSTRFHHDPNDPTSLSSDSIKSSGIDREGTFWVADGGGVEAFDRSSGRVATRVPMSAENEDLRFHEDSHGVFWIASSFGNGIATYDRKTNTVTRYSLGDATPEGGLTGVAALLETTSGEMWFATMGSGLVKFDRDNSRFDRYRNDPSDHESLTENRAISLFQDREGNIWTGLQGTPPVMFPKDSPMFHTLWPSPGHVDAMGESLVNAVFQDRQGSVWIGASGALNRLDKDGKVADVFTPAGPGTTMEVLSITQDSSGTMWIGTLGSGLYAFDPATRKFRSFRHSDSDADSISNDTVTRIHAEPSGTLWLSTWNGLDRYDPATGRFVTYRRNATASYEPYFSIARDGDKYLWLGTTEGFARFDRVAGTFKMFVHDDGDIQSLSNNTVDSVYLAPDGMLWIGTQFGLNRFDATTGKFQSFFESDGLAGNAVSCILGDGDGRLWMSTNQGVSRLDPRKMQFENFSTDDGLPGDDLTGWDACAKGNAGELYFGGFAGGTVKTNERFEDAALPPVVFTAIQIGNRPKIVVPSSSFVELKQPLTLPPGAEFLTIDFATPNFSNPKGTRYRYQLAGLENDWHMASNGGRSVSLASLPAGDFTLNVEAATKRGVWGSSGASLRILVLPAWWRTWWFNTIICVALLCVLVLIYRYRVSRVAAHYDLRFRERMAERNRVARDLHDTLLQTIHGLTFRLQAARHLLPEKPDEAALLLDVVLEKSDEAIAEGRDAVQALRDSRQADGDIVDALGAVGRELQSTHRSGAPPDFDIRAFGKSGVIEPAAREEVYRIVSEALRNAFRHSGASSIECTVYFSEDDLRIVVSDNGEGIAGLSGEPSRSRGWGVAGMKERAERVGATLLMESRTGSGTRVELHMKLRDDARRRRWGIFSR